MRRRKEEIDLIVKTMRNHADLIFKNGKVLAKKYPIWNELCGMLKTADLHITAGALYTIATKNYYNIWEECNILPTENPPDTTEQEEKDEGNIELQAEEVQQVEEELEEEENVETENDKEWCLEYDNNPDAFRFEVELTMDEYLKYLKPKEREAPRRGNRNRMVLNPEYASFLRRKINDYISCEFGISSYYVGKRAFPFLRLRGKCTECKASLYGRIQTEPAEEDIKIQFSVTNYSEDHIHKKKRRLTGAFREELVEIMAETGFGPSLMRQVLAANGVDPLNIPEKHTLRVAKYRKEKQKLQRHKNTFVALQMMQSEEPFSGTIRNIGCAPFFVYFWSDQQVLDFKNYVETTPGRRVSIEVTESVVNPLLRPSGKKSEEILLYEIVVNDQNCKFPVGHCLSEVEDAISISTWLLRYVASGAPSPYEICTNASREILSGVASAFLGMRSIEEYVAACGKIFFGGETNELKCYIRCDLRHVIKLISTWTCLQGRSAVAKERRKFYTRSMELLQKVEIWEEAEDLLVSIIAVALSKYVDSANSFRRSMCELEIDRLQALISGNPVPARTDLRLGDEGMAENNPFAGRLNFLIRAVTQEVERQGAGKIQNEWYCPELMDELKKLVEWFPVWTNIMRKYFPESQEMQDSAPSEGHFNDMKHLVFKDKKLPIRIDDFMEKYITFLQPGRMSEVNEATEIAAVLQPSEYETDQVIETTTTLEQTVKERQEIAQWAQETGIQMYMPILEEIQFYDCNLFTDVCDNLNARDLNCYFFTKLEDMNVFINKFCGKRNYKVHCKLLTENSEDYSTHALYHGMEGPEILKKFVMEQILLNESIQNPDCDMEITELIFCEDNQGNCSNMVAEIQPSTSQQFATLADHDYC